MNINWDNLRVFLAVARSRSAFEAAGPLGMDHSTITRRLKRLENDIGSKLFDRSPQGHVLTVAGHRLLESVIQIENTLEVIDSEVGGDNQVLTGRVRLGSPAAFGNHFLAPHVADFCARHPTIHVDLLAGAYVVNLSKREADLAIGLERPQSGAYAVCKLGESRHQLYATRQYLENCRAITKLDDLLDHRLIGYIDESAFRSEHRCMEILAPGSTIRMRTTSVVAQLHAARRGHTLAVLPCFLACAYPDLIPVLPGTASMVRTLWLFTQKEHRDIARVRVLWDFLRETVHAHRGLLMGKTI